MCGITGYWAPGGDPGVFQEDLSRAVAALGHRGPDDHGTWFDDAGVGLGHRRLSVLDLSSCGHQPMLSRDGAIAMVFNGEIYNFREIRRELESLGHAFRGTGDAETILASYAQWGPQCVDRWIGMFAVAFWDARRRRLCLLRDRAGVKPLYYGWDRGVFWFASELKAMRAYRHWSPELDRESLGEFFHYGYISSPRSIYTCVRKLPAGHRLELDAAGTPSVRPYWSLLGALERGPLRGSEDELTERLEHLLVDAFSLRLVSDVPVGVFLSGGIDSSLVAALLQRHAPDPIHTFTIGFEEQAFDESPWAKRIAGHLGTRHTERVLSAGSAREILPDWADLYDEPFADSSGLPTQLISRITVGEVKVALSADGGDELFGGYDKYGLMPRRVARLERIPRPLRGLSGGILRRTPRRVLDGLFAWMGNGRLSRVSSRKMVDRLAKLGILLPDVRPEQVYDLAQSFWLVPEIDRLLGGYRPPRDLSDAYPGSYEERMMLWDFHHYLPEDILTKVDRATMSVSLEGREPMLDHRLIEYAFRLPLDMRRGPLGSKHCLRKILYKYVPREMIDRPKQGFAIPLAEWLRGDLSGLIDEYLDPERIRRAGVLDPGSVATTVAEFRREGVTDVNRVWFLLAFEMWRERWG